MKKILFLILVFVPIFGFGQANTVNSASSATSSDFMLDIAKGNIVGTSQINKFGQNPAIAANTEEDVWDGSNDYAYPTTATITHLRQAVDQSAMQGQIIEIQGLNSSWVLVVQNVTLNASNTTTPVALGTALIRVFRMKVLANVVTDQNIELRNAAGSTTYSIIQAGNNQTLMALFTVPLGKTAYMTKYYASVTEATGKEPKSTEVRIWAADRANSYEFQLKHAVGIPKAGSLIEYCFEPYLKFTQKTDIRMSAYCDSEVGVVSGGFDLILIDN